MARKIIDEILDIKSRFDISEDKSARFFNKYGPLLRSFSYVKNNINQKNIEIKNELLKYFPIALVAIVEGYYRETIKEMIDNNKFYRDKLSRFNHLKFSIEPILAIDANSVSIGELVSHLVAINNISNINDTMKLFTDRDFIKDIKALININYEINTKSKQDNAKIIFKHLNNMFEMRHIFCHELSNSVSVDEIELEQMFTSVTWLYLATEVYVTHIPNGETKAYDIYYKNREA